MQFPHATHGQLSAVPRSSNFRFMVSEAKVHAGIPQVWSLTWSDKLIIASLIWLSCSHARILRTHSYH